MKHFPKSGIYNAKICLKQVMILNSHYKKACNEYC